MDQNIWGHIRSVWFAIKASNYQRTDTHKQMHTHTHTYSSCNFEILITTLFISALGSIFMYVAEKDAWSLSSPSLLVFRAGLSCSLCCSMESEDACMRLLLNNYFFRDIKNISCMLINLDMKQTTGNSEAIEHIFRYYALALDVVYVPQF